MDLSSIAITTGRILLADSGGKNVGNLDGCPVQWLMFHLTKLRHSVWKMLWTEHWQRYGPLLWTEHWQ